MSFQPVSPWGAFKRYFKAWDTATTPYLDSLLKNPLLLEPVAGCLGAATKLKRAADTLSAGLWSGMGLPTRRDQERTLHVLHQLESRLIDLEERLEDLQGADLAPRE